MKVDQRTVCAALLLVPGIAAFACGTPGARSAAEGSGERTPSSNPGLHGTISDSTGSLLAGVFVTARDPVRRVAVSVLTDGRGRYQLPRLAPANYRVEAHGYGFRGSARDSVAPGAESPVLDLSLAQTTGPLEPPNSAARLRELPDGEVKRRFILDCTGCHQFAQPIVEVDGRPRTHDEWVAAVEKMLSFAGAQSGFPIISPERDAQETADWLTEALGEDRDQTKSEDVPAGIGGGAGAAAPGSSGETAHAVFTEYDLPNPDELPHDLTLDREGRVVVTGMLRSVMYRLDPASGAFEEIPIPLPQAGPRALEIDPQGVWWVLLGGPEKIGRFDPPSGEWKTYDIGMYPHSVTRDQAGRIWFNGHFTKDPIRIGSLDTASGQVRMYDLPPTPDTRGSPIPYELRAAPDGSIWGTELAGNRIFRFDPVSGTTRAYEMPTPYSGPRRLDVAPDGTVWIPAYATGVLFSFDPRTERFAEHALPTRDALPYVARVDRKRGTVWVAEAGADAIARFDPGTGHWIELPLPTASALIRHMDVDSETGAVWAAYGNFPPVEPKVLRLEMTEP